MKAKVTFCMVVCIMSLTACRVPSTPSDIGNTTSQEASTDTSTEASISQSQSMEESSSHTDMAAEAFEDILERIPNPSREERKQNTITVKEDCLVPAYRFFNLYYDTFMTLEVQDFEGVLAENENTDIMKNMLRYRIAYDRVNEYWIRDYTYELSIDREVKSETEVILELYCQAELESSEGHRPGERLPYQVHLELKDGSWSIASITSDTENANFYSGFVNKLLDLNKEYPGHDMSIFAMTDIMIERDFLS